MSYRVLEKVAAKYAIVGPYAERWAQSRELLKLSSRAIREGHDSEALQALDTAHNLGRDSVALHAITHLRYVRFALHDSNYRRAVGHIFWAMISPVIVPIERRKRTATIGNWTPPGEKLVG